MATQANSSLRVWILDENEMVIRTVSFPDPRQEFQEELFRDGQNQHLSVKFRRSSVSRLLKERIIERDGRKCSYCKKDLRGKHLTVDHVLPVCQGGTDELDNLVLACRPCNICKGGRTPTEWIADVLDQEHRALNVRG